MYVRRLKISNVRSIEQFDVRFAEEKAPGWHVVLGSNGAGKSSVIRSLALALAGPKEAAALRQNWGTWARAGTNSSEILLEIACGPKDVFTGVGRRRANVTVTLEFRPIETPIGGPGHELQVKSGKNNAERSFWGTNTGWFSASFGPFRRFSGGDQAFDRLYYSNPRLASHLSAFGEDVALTEGLRWLSDLRIQQLENNQQSGQLLDAMITFLNNSDLLPHDATIADVRSEDVLVIDGNGTKIAIDQMSDGYRSILSMIFEIFRQMNKSNNTEDFLQALDLNNASVRLPGVVAIDEVDAHLHPSWQKQIGPWFTKCFPEVQFLVTTHSPIICRNADTVWYLPTPGSHETGGKIEGIELQRLIYGSILEAYGTEIFGKDITRSDNSKELVQEIAKLNQKALRVGLDRTERQRLDELRSILPTESTDTDAA